MWLKEMFVLFLSLALGYMLCVVAKKEKHMLKTVGYTLGISIMALSFLFALVSSMACSAWKGKPCMDGKMMRCIQTMKHHR